MRNHELIEYNIDDGRHVRVEFATVPEGVRITTQSSVFDIQELHITSDEHVAFCLATMKCSNRNESGEFEDLDFRLTIGLKKINNGWTVMHEHHSIPSE